MGVQPQYTAYHCSCSERVLCANLNLTLWLDITMEILTYFLNTFEQCSGWDFLWQGMIKNQKGK